MTSVRTSTRYRIHPRLNRPSRRPQQGVDQLIPVSGTRLFARLFVLQFLPEGARRGERVLYITLSETKRELRLVAKRHGWSLGGIDIFELVPPETTLDPERELTVFHPVEMELSETTNLVLNEVKHFFTSRNCTVILLDDLSAQQEDLQLHSISHGVVFLEQRAIQ